MKCMECQELGLKSKVYSQGSSSTLMGYTPYYDEDGKYHDHDANTVTEGFKCSNNHFFSKKAQKKCWCGWESN